MLQVKQFRCGADNLSYVIYGKRKAAAVDGVAWQEIMSFLRKGDLELAYVANTHSHFDHTSGDDYLLRSTKAKFLRFTDLLDGINISLDGENVLVYRTPGHTADSVCFYTGKFLISGDTLFNGTVGNCFTGDLKSFYRSIKKLTSLPDETIVYAGHDYVYDSVSFAARLEPDNQDIVKFRASYDSGHVYSTMAEERLINPYLRFNEETIIALIKMRGLPVATEEERWLSLMSID